MWNQSPVPLVVSLVSLLAIGDVLRGEEIEVKSVLLRLIEQVDIPAQEAGVLTTIAVREGDAVEPGTLLAQIDDANVRLQKERADLDLRIAELESLNQTDIAEASEELAVAKEDHKRGKESRDTFRKAITDAALNQLRLTEVRADAKLSRAQHQLEVAAVTRQLKQKDLALMQNSLDRRMIKTPIAGVVVDVLKHNGEWVEPGDKVVRVVRLDRLRAEGFIEARFALRSLVGQPVAVNVSNDPTRTFQGKIVFVSPEIDPVNQQARVWAEVDNTMHALRPGLRARMVITGDVRDAPTPAGARGTAPGTAQ